MMKTWQQASRVFNDRADEYDSWFENSLLFDIELAAIKELAVDLPAPRLELGVGPGRFAEQLGVNFGIDPAPAALKIAGYRGVAGIAGTGEQLPLRNDSIGTLCMFFTLCFLADPAAVFRECARVLRSDGILLLGFIPASSSWGKVLTQKKKQHHPYYRYADFKTIEGTKKLLLQANFSLAQTRSTLLQPPDNLKHFEKPQTGMDEQAGFCALTADNRKHDR